MTIQNVVVCDQKPDWFRAATPDDPTSEKELAMWQEIADGHRYFRGLTYRIKVMEVEA